MNRRSSFLARPLRWAPAVVTALALSLPAFAADEPAKQATEAGREAAKRAAEQVEEYSAAATDLNKAEVKAALAELDAQIEKLESLAETAPDGARRDAIAVRLDALQERRDALGTEFNRARFDELKTDVQREWNEFKAWVHDKTHDDAVAVTDESERRHATTHSEAVATRDTADHVRTPETGSVAVTRPAEQTGDAARPAAAAQQEHQRVALERVDRALDDLEDRIDALDRPEQQQRQAQLETFEARRDDLEDNFSDERYTALMREILSEAERAPAVAE